MPCYSRIFTKMNNADTLGAALAALGWTVKKDGFNVYAEKGDEAISFSRYDSVSPFSATGDTFRLAEIGRKYAETSARRWASQRGFGITENDGVNMTLVNRRGGN